MGRVFTYEEIESGRVPSRNDFDAAKEFFREQVRACCSEGTIDGGFIFGSVGRGTPTPRSDFDVFIATTDNSDTSYAAARTITQNVRQHFNGSIQIEPIAYSRPVLASGYHEIDHMFGQHLLGEFRQVEGNDPKEYIHFREKPISEILGDYAFRKVRKLTDAYMMGSHTVVEGSSLQRMLELPNSLGRKLLQSLAYYGHIEGNDGSDKSEVFRKTNELFSEYGLAETFRELSASDAEYSEVLDQMINGRGNRNTYNEMIAHLHSQLPRSAEWAREVGKTFVPILEAYDLGGYENLSA